MSRLNAILLVVLAFVVPSAFSAGEAASTTAGARAAGAARAGAQPATAAGSGLDIDPATGLARTTVVRPLREFPAPPTGPATPGTTPERVPGASARGHLALILPTASPVLGRLAEAVRQGFVAATQVAGKDAPPVDVIPVADEGATMIEACRNAQAAGALLVIAAITRDGATALAKSDCAREPVLALNEPQGILPPDLPRNLFTVSLSIEQEARQVALMAVADGRRSAIVIGSSSPLARRVREAFEREWSRAAGEIRHVDFSGNPEDGPLLRDQLESSKGDMVFLALEPVDARAVRPYVPAALPIYATSLSVNPRAESIVNLDLEGVRYVEMPWFVQPDHPAVMVYPQPSAPMSVDQERLYAFGIDAFRLALHMLRGDARRTPLDGVTGRITLESGNAFLRTLTPADVEDGRVVPLRSP
ncbi:MAG TPA: penicillin-binding protein activator [Usitatibacter sp.]|nr:penicillin-binding protein activator [Usitatibacter sp.]